MIRQLMSGQADAKCKIQEKFLTSFGMTGGARKIWERTLAWRSEAVKVAASRSTPKKMCRSGKGRKGKRKHNILLYVGMETTSG
jgi:hypothetical protein